MPGPSDALTLEEQVIASKWNEIEKYQESIKTLQTSVDTIKTSATQYINTEVYERAVRHAELKLTEKKIDFIKNVIQPLREMVTQQLKTLKKKDSASTGITNKIQIAQAQLKILNLLQEPSSQANGSRDITTPVSQHSPTAAASRAAGHGVGPAYAGTLPAGLSSATYPAAPAHATYASLHSPIAAAVSPASAISYPTASPSSPSVGDIARQGLRVATRQYNQNQTYAFQSYVSFLTNSYGIALPAAQEFAHKQIKPGIVYTQEIINAHIRTLQWLSDQRHTLESAQQWLEARDRERSASMSGAPAGSSSLPYAPAASVPHMAPQGLQSRVASPSPVGSSHPITPSAAYPSQSHPMHVGAAASAAGYGSPVRPPHTGPTHSGAIPTMVSSPAYRAATPAGTSTSSINDSRLAVSPAPTSVAPQQTPGSTRAFDSLLSAYPQPSARLPSPPRTCFTPPSAPVPSQEPEQQQRQSVAATPVKKLTPEALYQTLLQARDVLHDRKAWDNIKKQVVREIRKAHVSEKARLAEAYQQIIDAHYSPVKPGLFAANTQTGTRKEVDKILAEAGITLSIRVEYSR